MTKPRVAEADVLHEDRIAWHRLRAGCHRDPPQPEPCARVQPERDLCRRPPVSPVPGEAVGGDGERDLRARADNLGDPRLRRADAQIEARDPAVERRAPDLVDQRPTALVPMLDREHASVGQNAERQAGWVRDAPQTEIAFAGVSKLRAARGVIPGLPSPADGDGKRRHIRQRRHCRLTSPRCQPPLAIHSARPSR